VLSNKAMQLTGGGRMSRSMRSAVGCAPASLKARPQLIASVLRTGPRWERE
jgi:hypothetical protein